MQTAVVKFINGIIAGCFLSLALFVTLALVISPKNPSTLSSNQLTTHYTKKLLLSPTPKNNVSGKENPFIQQARAQESTNGYCLYVPVLFYHHIEPIALAKVEGHAQLTVDSTIFEQQMQYLILHGYNTITAKQLFDALTSHGTLPPKSIVLTFDDGYSDIYQYAYPIFQKYHLTANLMIPTGLMGGPDYLTWDQISEMKNSGFIYYTDHTWSHYDVSHGSLEKIKFEIETAKQELEQHTGQTVDVFTYPYGPSGPTALQVLQQDGFVGAFTTTPGKYECTSTLLTEPRVRIGNANLSYYGL